MFGGGSLDWGHSPFQRFLILIPATATQTFEHALSPNRTLARVPARDPMFRQPAAQPRQENRYGLLALQPTRLKIGNKMHRSAAPLDENHNKQKPTASYPALFSPNLRVTRLFLTFDSHAIPMFLAMFSGKPDTRNCNSLLAFCRQGLHSLAPGYPQRRGRTSALITDGISMGPVRDLPSQKGQATRLIPISPKKQAKEPVYRPPPTTFPPKKKQLAC